MPFISRRQRFKDRKSEYITDTYNGQIIIYLSKRLHSRTSCFGRMTCHSVNGNCSILILLKFEDAQFYAKSISYLKNLLIDSSLILIVGNSYLSTDMHKFESSQKGESRVQSADSSTENLEPLTVVPDKTCEKTKLASNSRVLVFWSSLIPNFPQPQLHCSATARQHSLLLQCKAITE